MTLTIGILLAGGLSRRFGSPKAFAKIDGEFFYEHAYRALDRVCDDVIIVSRPELLSRFPTEYDVITDLDWIAGKGPLAGIFSGMTAKKADKYVVLPCDMPFIGPTETIKLVALADKKADITTVWNRNERIPLFSIWDGCIKDLLQNELEVGQLRVMKFMEKVTTEWIDTSEIHKDQHVFRNVNYPDD